MFDLVLIIILLMGFLVGLRRGFILQIVHLTGFIVAFIVAYLYYDELMPKLILWIPYPSFGDAETMKFLFDSTNLETSYYRAIAFAIIFFATKFLWQIIGSMLDFLANLPILKQINGWAGGLLGFVEVYLIVFIVLYIGALLPVEMVQSNLNDSFMAKMIVQHTPFFTGKIKDMWI
jgi:uncharacterized membrane protein required for colicin V production